MKLTIIKSFWVGIFIVFSGAFLNARNLHLILVADLSAPTLKEGIKRNVKDLSETFESLANEQKVSFKKYYLIKESPRFDELKTLIAGLICSEDDIIVFHYSGHGTNNVSYNRWPNLLIQNSAIEEQANLELIHILLKAKKTKLLLTIADCCNKGMRERCTISRLKTKTINTLSKGSVSLLDSAGDIIMSACRMGQNSHYTSTLGGYFTLSFLYSMTNFEHNGSWELLLEQTKQCTKQLVEEIGYVQEPQFYLAVEPPETGEWILYTVKEGDTLFNITKVHSVSVASIMDWNKLSKTLIVKGQELKIFKLK